MFRKPAMMLENSNNFFEVGCGITYQNPRRLLECPNNHFEEGSVRILKIIK
jgi:hypothetical protein